MQEVFEKIIEKLENASFWTDSSFDEDGNCNDDSEEAVYLHEAIKIVKQEADQYNNAIIDVKYCFQSCACTEKCDKCSRLCNGYIDWYENIDNWTEEYNNVWIPCSSGRLPEENTDVEVTIEEIANDVGGKRYYNVRSWLQDGHWVIKKNPYNPTVIAWKYPTEPYHPKGE